MLVKLIDNRDLYRFKGLLEFIDAVIDSDMKHYATEIIEMVEMGKDEELLQAMKRAQDACVSLGIPVDEHFKKIYRESHHDVICDYKLSPLAFGLVCINANPSNRNVAQIQVGIVKKLLGEE
jgi:hypothetical protein